MGFEMRFLYVIKKRVSGYFLTKETVNYFEVKNALEALAAKQ